MNKKEEIIDKIFIILIAVTFMIPGFLSIDQMFPEFLYLSFVQIITTLYIFFVKKSDYVSLIKQNLSLISFVLFLLIALISSYNATNFQLSIIELTVFFTFFITYLNLTVLFHKNENLIEFTVLLSIFLISVESLKVIYRAYEIYDFYKPNLRHPSYAGFSSNVNVTSFSILVKTPFLFYFINTYKTKKFALKLGLYSIFFISTSAIFLCYSRGAILTLLLIFVLYFIYNFSVKKNNVRYKSIILLLILIISYTTNKLIFINVGSDVVDRATTFDFSTQDSSINSRIGYYLDALNGISEKPFFGWGIGNWKIQSIQFAKDRIKEYQVPYHTHNDFLQMGAETGLIGAIFYLIIFLFPFYFLSKKIISDFNSNQIYFFLLLSIIVFLFDSNFNFPRARPTSIVNISFLMAFINSFIRSKTK